MPSSSKASTSGAKPKSYRVGGCAELVTTEACRTRAKEKEDAKSKKSKPKGKPQQHAKKVILSFN